MGLSSVSSPGIGFFESDSIPLSESFVFKEPCVEVVEEKELHGLLV